MGPEPIQGGDMLVPNRANCPCAYGIVPFAHGYPSAYGAHPIYVWGSSFFFFDFELVGSLRVAILSPYVLHTLTWSSKKSTICTDWPTMPLAAIHSIENIINYYSYHYHYHCHFPTSTSNVDDEYQSSRRQCHCHGCCHCAACPSSSPT